MSDDGSHLRNGREPFVSVVTPFYNTERYLAECIESVLAQSHRNFEYILADNCSTDGSLAIARRYAAMDSRIRVVTHSEFVDQIPNYNRAIRYIARESRYCKVVQADDWIYPDCIERMVACAEEHPEVGIVGCCFVAGEQVAGHGLPFDRNVFDGREVCRTRLLRGHTYFGSPTNLLYRADIVRRRDPFYPEGVQNADTAVCFEILADAAFGRVPQILANLRRNPGSKSQRLHELGAGDLADYLLFERYGPRFLGPEELRERRASLEKTYLRSLARASLRRPGREYWTFHEQAMRSIGRRIPKLRVALHVADYVADKVLNPRRSLESLLERRRRRLE